MQIRRKLKILPTLETASRKYGHQNISHAFASDSAHKSMGTKYDKWDLWISPYQPVDYNNPEELVACFDDCIAEARIALDKFTDDNL